MGSDIKRREIVKVLVSDHPNGVNENYDGTSIAFHYDITMSLKDDPNEDNEVKTCKVYFTIPTSASSMPIKRNGLYKMCVYEKEFSDYVKTLQATKKFAVWNESTPDRDGFWIEVEL